MSNVPSNANFSPVWPGPSLLVPVTLDCLLVGSADRTGATWAQTGNNYYNMWYRMLPDTPPPLQPKSDADAPLSGAHLIWTLPYALRHGQQQQSGENAGGVDFPRVPNRWLVLRTQYSATGQPPNFAPTGDPPILTAWVIQSDRLTPITAAPTPYNQYPDPNDAAQPVKLIGSFVLLADWNGEALASAPVVQAVGPGDVSWGVAYDNIKNVFGFYDNLPNQNLLVSYSVIGWYDTPANDPLFVMPTDSAANWQTQVESEFQWSVGESQQDIQNAQDAWLAWAQAHGLAGDPAPLENLPPQLRQAMQNWLAWAQAHGETAPQQPLPRQLVCHGLVTNVEWWHGSGGSYGSGAPGGGIEYPHVSIGNTATEAIAAWFSDFVVNKYSGDPNTIPVIERAVEAFQKNALSTLETDPVAAESLLHRARFNASFRGKEWIVARPESAEGTVGQYGGQQTVPLDDVQTQKLIDLNARQTEFDQTTALLFTQRLELFKVYYKSQIVGRKPPLDIDTKVTQALTALQGDGVNLQGAVQASLDQQARLQDTINQLSQSLSALLKDDYEVLLVDKPSCYAPADPVVMVAGAQYDTKFAAPGAYSDDEMLFTRFTGQTVTGIKIDTGNGQSSATLDASDLLGQVTLPLGQPIPKEAQDLWLEALWLDPSIATQLATLYYKKIGQQGDIPTLAQQIAAQQRAIYNNAGALGVSVQTLGKIAQLQGTPPATTALQFRTAQPWTPIYMDWKVKWFPSYTANNASLSDWELDDIDYSWTGTNVPQPTVPLEFVGRTVLNPKIARDLSTQLSQFKDDPDYAQLPIFIRTSLEELAQEIVTFDILTQSLGGLTEQLTTQLMTPNRSPENKQTADLLGSDPVSFRPIPGGVKDKTSQPFFPIRAGHLQVIDLWVVDCFGQVLLGKNPQFGANAPIPNLVRAESVSTPGAGNSAYVQLPPRISQPAYVELRLLQADNDQIPSNSSDLTNPICGWVMPNHLDDSMMVFDAAGQNLGAVIKVQTDITAANPQGTGLRWDAVPGTEAPLGAPPNLPNSHLQAFINGLLQRGWLSGGAALTELLQSIDTSLWTITPLGGQEGNLSVLLGRALAIVRADLSLNLSGLPTYDQSWMNTGAYYLKDGQYSPTEPPFTATEFAVRVGDLAYTTNGVVGYFLDDQYDTFYAVYGSEGQTAQLVESLRQPSTPVASAMSIEPLSKSQAAGDYVQSYTPIMQPSDGTKSYLTILMDPRGVIPIITGSLPEVQLALAPGPVTAALGNMKATFRTGPLLTDPSKIRMPIPAEIKGQWGWLARTDVTTWGDEQAIVSQDSIARLETSPLRLSEGWLTLSGAETEQQSES